MIINVTYTFTIYQFTPRKKKTDKKFYVSGIKYKHHFMPICALICIIIFCAEDTLYGGLLQFLLHAAFKLFLRLLIISQQYLIDISTMKTQS